MPYPHMRWNEESFIPSHVKVLAAIVTCGGLCPGLNDVVQNIAYTLHDHGVPEENVLGIRCEDVWKRGNRSKGGSDRRTLIGATASLYLSTVTPPIPNTHEVRGCVKA